MKIMTEQPRPYEQGLPPANSFSQIRQIGFYGDFGIPEQRACQFCGKHLGEGECWASAAAYDSSNGTTGFSFVFHCRDCDPFTQLDGLQHLGEARTTPPCDDWKVVQGEV